MVELPTSTVHPDFADRLELARRSAAPIHSRYLPFSEDHLLRHFLRADPERRQLRYYRESAQRYTSHLSRRRSPARPLALADMRLPRQIEKDERFWVVACLMSYFHAPNRTELLASLLRSAFADPGPPVDLASWQDCLEGDLHLFFEVDLPSPRTYREALRNGRVGEHPIPYVREAAARDSERALEGPTQVDAVIVNRTNGFAVTVRSQGAVGCVLPRVVRRDSEPDREKRRRDARAARRSGTGRSAAAIRQSTAS